MNAAAPDISTEIPQTKEKLFEELYEQTFPAVARLVGKLSGSFQDAKDIFHDALIIYYEKKRDHQLQIQVTPEAYILGIAKHLWLKKFKQVKNQLSFSALEKEISLPADYDTPENNRLLALLQISGRKCLELLQAFYYDQLALPDIALLFGFTTIRSATVQKYKCLEKVRDKVKEKLIGYEDLVE